MFSFWRKEKQSSRKVAVWLDGIMRDGPPSWHFARPKGETEVKWGILSPDATLLSITHVCHLRWKWWGQKISKAFAESCRRLMVQSAIEYNRIEQINFVVHPNSDRNCPLLVRFVFDFSSSFFPFHISWAVLPGPIKFRTSLESL